MSIGSAFSSALSFSRSSTIDQESVGGGGGIFGGPRRGSRKNSGGSAAVAAAPPLASVTFGLRLERPPPEAADDMNATLTISVEVSN